MSWTVTLGIDTPRPRQGQYHDWDQEQENNLQDQEQDSKNTVFKLSVDETMSLRLPVTKWDPLIQV